MLSSFLSLVCQIPNGMALRFFLNLRTGPKEEFFFVVENDSDHKLVYRRKKKKKKEKKIKVRMKKMGEQRPSGPYLNGNA